MNPSGENIVKKISDKKPEENWSYNWPQNDPSDSKSHQITKCAYDCFCYEGHFKLIEIVDDFNSYDNDIKSITYKNFVKDS